MTHKVESGIYIIASHEKGNHYAGRALYEDFGLGPKRVIILPAGVQAPRWIIDEIKPGRYKLKINGDPTGELDKHVYAFLTHEHKAEEWILTLHENHGHNVYTIETSDEKRGWILSKNKPDTQIAVGPLKATKSLPPHFPDNELWTLTRFDRN